MLTYPNTNSNKDLKLDVLISCMHQDDFSILSKSKIIGDAVIINQCDENGFAQCSTSFGTAKMYSVNERGLTRSRNLAIEKSDADICLLCDDDEVFEYDYRRKIISAYKRLKDADVIIFKMKNRKPSFKNKVKRLRFPLTMKVSSWQISFRRESIIKNDIKFDVLLGAGSGNGAEEELKFLTDCEKKKLKIYYVPAEIASVAQTQSTWFNGYDKKFFRNRGNTTRYILGLPLASLYAIYYVVIKKKEYAKYISTKDAFISIFKGIFENKISKLKKKEYK